ncbi:hypothetical protein QN277_009735 [Acacia crassicarpa]|uniref:WAT1-related protein n=1 Tax=Acacia crassicarpa TaxID=499986 RepID=A0AAE1MC53_9FABA|nr:hypothetical protein QN277_009735 [Acacia crassicarpa]
MARLSDCRIKVTSGVKGIVLMVIVQILYTGTNILYNIVANHGISMTVIVAYRFLFSTFFIVPLALLFEREGLKEIDGTVIYQAGLSGLFGGFLQQNLFLHSLKFVSVSFATAIMSLVPLATYIMAVHLGNST